MDKNFIPANTIITIETDGSGDFTKLSDAVDYLTGKWSNGTVTIQLGEGEFVEDDKIINIENSPFNIPTLIVTGSGQDKTNVIFDYNDPTTNTSGIRFHYTPVCMTFQDMTLTDSASQRNNTNFLRCTGSFLRMLNCTITKLSKNSNIYVGARMATALFAECSISNSINGLNGSFGAITTILNCTFTNVTNKTVSGQGTYFNVTT